jgi:transglutaminase-like putative cysteine protease
MQSASPRGSFELAAVPGQALQRTREAIPASTMWSAVIVFALVVTIARSTVAALWVPAGIDGVPFVALGAAVLMSLLAVSSLPAWLCVTVGIVAGPVVSAIVSSSQFRLERPTDPSGAGFVQVWTIRVFDGSAFGDQAFVGFLITLLMWVTGAWLAWCVVRWRQPLIGLIPGAAAFATNVLNTNNQQGFTFIFLALTLGLLLWTTYATAVARAAAARIKTTGDARWDFWETGLFATVALLVIGIMMPPISTVDRTATMESSLFQGWADFQNKLNRVGIEGNGPGGAASTGFSTSISLGKQLTQSGAPVFAYSVSAGVYPGPSYFRGVNDTILEMVNGVPAWTYGDVEYRQQVAANELPPFSEQYSSMALATFTINMQQPPVSGADIYFYPGQVYGLNQPAIAQEVNVPPLLTFTSQLATIDRLSAGPPGFSSKGIYNVTVEYPDVTSDQLRAAGSDYAAWLQPYAYLPPKGYRPPEVIKYIHDLALQITAGATNPYDKATAIETYLRSSNFTYHLKPKVAPDGEDALYYFLHDSHDGYCQYFAMAMGEMLRSLGIPTRLVSGYGAGIYDDITHRFQVRDQDAHVWVESYFPGYGWIPFEPTNDGVYQPIRRGVTITGLCLRDNNCTNPPPLVVASPPAAHSPNRIKDPGASGDQAVNANQSPFRWLDSTAVTRILGGLLALLLLMAAIGARYLRPRTVMGVWRRVLVLARLAGAELQPGETPLELDRRLGRVFPEAAQHLHALTGAFVVAAYAPPEMAQATKPSVMEAWSSLRPVMLRRVASRIRPGRY